MTNNSTTNDSETSTDEHVRNIAIDANNVIQYELVIKTLNNTDANGFRDMLIQIRTDPCFLDALTNFSHSFWF